MELNWENFIKKLKEFNNQAKFEKLDIKENQIQMRDMNNNLVELTKEQFKKEIKLDLNFDPTNHILTNSFYYETMIETMDEWKEISPKTAKRDDINYTISTSSHQFLFNFILNKSPLPTQLRNRGNLQTGVTLVEILNGTFDCPFTIRIESNRKMEREEFEERINSYLYDICDSGKALRTRSENEDFWKTVSRRRYKKYKEYQDINPSHKKYDKELTARYRKGLVSNDPNLKYLYYYQIVEYFFEEKRYEEKKKEIENIIQNQELINEKSKKIMKIIDPTRPKPGEKEDLKETLKNHVDLEKLKMRLDNFIPWHNIQKNIRYEGESITEYYKTVSVKYSSKPCCFDIENKTKWSETYDKIAERIYSTRNSIVHNKSNEYSNSKREMYDVFEDEENLENEIPLIQSIAEEVINSTAQNYDY